MKSKMLPALFALTTSLSAYAAAPQTTSYATVEQKIPLYVNGVNLESRDTKGYVKGQTPLNMNCSMQAKVLRVSTSKGVQNKIEVQFKWEGLDSDTAKSGTEHIETMNIEPSHKFQFNLKTEVDNPRPEYISFKNLSTQDWFEIRQLENGDFEVKMKKNSTEGRCLIDYPEFD